MSSLNDEQKELFNIITKERKNIFFTGCAGTGKSFLLKELIDYFRHSLTNGKLISVTASTGRAAFNIGGSTLHSFAGIGLGNEDVHQLIKRIEYNKKVSSRWRSTQVLVIDEISMISGDLFDKLEQIARSICKNTKPFGGIQLIITGDLLQLPPVNTTNNELRRVFEAESWSKSIDKCIALRTVMRQSDWEFISILTCIRLGAPTDEVKKFIERISREKTYDSESGPVNLYATKAKTDKFNAEKLSKIDNLEVTYTAQDQYFSTKNKSIHTLLDNCPAPYELTIKKDAQVMLVKNISTDLVNGTVGIVTNFTNYVNPITKEVSEIPIVRFTLNNGRVHTKPLHSETWEIQSPGGMVDASRTQIPLILAWAVTIHKSQGQTIQKVKADLTGVFESGQVYTALSRAISAETLEVVGFDITKMKVDEKCVNFYVDNNLI